MKKIDAHSHIGTFGGWAGVAFTKEKLIEQMNEYCKKNHILKTPQEIARIYSKEIEYSQENMEIIFEELLFG